MRTEQTEEEHGSATQEGGGGGGQAGCEDKLAFGGSMHMLYM